MNEIDPEGTDVAVGPQDHPWLVLGDFNYEQSKEFYDGEMSTLDPYQWYTGTKDTIRYLKERQYSGAAFKSLGAGMISGLEFWNQSDPRKAGQGFFTDVMIAAPVIKKIPNFTGIEIADPMLTPITGAKTGITFFKVSIKGKEQFRLDYGELPDKQSIPAGLRLKKMLHYHRRGGIDPKTGQTFEGQGIRRHRPYEDGTGSKF